MDKEDGVDGSPSNGAMVDRPYWYGHRQRLKERFLSAVRADALDTLAGYELLELILFLALPRADVKPMAKALIERFGSLGGVVSADPQALAALPGIKDAAITAIKTVQAATLHVLREEVIDKPVLSSWERLLDYCHASMAFRDIEQFRVLFLDRKNRLI